jgi:hypothetical protein
MSEEMTQREELTCTDCEIFSIVTESEYSKVVREIKDFLFSTYLQFLNDEHILKGVCDPPMSDVPNHV